MAKPGDRDLKNERVFEAEVGDLEPGAMRLLDFAVRADQKGDFVIRASAAGDPKLSTTAEYRASFVEERKTTEKPK